LASSNLIVVPDVSETAQIHPLDEIDPGDPPTFVLRA
jgi:hypothetical protein